MRTGAVLFPAFGALALLPAVTARADVTSCRDEARQMAQTYLLSVSPTAPSAAQSSRGGSAETPATTESRGMTAATDSLASSGGTLPPSTSSGASEPRGSASAVPQLGAADRAKVEGLLSDAQAGDALGKADECRKIFQEALAVVKKARP